MDIIKHMRKVTKENFPEMIKFDYSLPAFFGQIVFAYRIRKKLTQDELATLMEVEPRVIHKIEGGGAFDLPIEIFEKAFSVLEINYKDLGEGIVELATDYEKDINS